MLKVQVPPQYPQERAYIVGVLLNEFLGLEYELFVSEPNSNMVISDDHHQLMIADVFFQTPDAQWLQPSSLPKLPLDTWVASLRPQVSNLPVIFGRKAADGAYYLAGDDGAFLGLDIFGSAFFMLTRYEEVVKTERDSYERFPAAASLAQQAGFLMRPIINEYLDILWEALLDCFPRLQRKSRHFRTILSHDVDQPFGGAGRSLTRVARSMAGDFKKGRSLPVTLKRAQSWLSHDFDGDPCNTFDYLMDVSEKHGLISAFYFICAHSGGAVDGDYTLDQPYIQSLMRQINARGHEIGLHPSYNTFRNAQQLHLEFDRLRATCAAQGIQQTVCGGRQHYLRWENPTTWQLWEDTGLAYDSSLTFSDSIGFRSGVCYEYPVFNLHTRQALKLRERPLVVMEVSLWDYMGLRETNMEAALTQILPLMKACKRYQGDFTLLWHNHSFRFDIQKRMYEQIIEAAVDI